MVAENSQLNSASGRPPIWRNPVGEGAKRVMTLMIEEIGENRDEIGWMKGLAHSPPGRRAQAGKRLLAGQRIDWGEIADRSHAFLAAERPNWPGWLAVMLGLGIASYFALPAEPPLWLGGAGVAVLGRALSWCDAGRSWRSRSAGCWPPAPGSRRPQWRTLPWQPRSSRTPLRFAHVEGRLAEIEPFPTGIRATLDQLHIPELPPEATPERIPSQDIQRDRNPDHRRSAGPPGQLQPPSPPTAPGAFDFRRQAYFKGSAPPALRWARRAWSSLRTKRRSASVSGPGSIASARPSGSASRRWSRDRRAPWPARSRSATRRRSPPRIPMRCGSRAWRICCRSPACISAWLRGCSSSACADSWHSCPRWRCAIRSRSGRPRRRSWPAGFYSLLAGATVPTERSFLMIAIVFLGVMLDRSPSRSACWHGLPLSCCCSSPRASRVPVSRCRSSPCWA